MYKIFYPTQGKWHTRDKITGVATCGNFIVQGNNDQSIHVQANATNNHPLLCKKCLKKEQA